MAGSLCPSLAVRGSEGISLVPLTETGASLDGCHANISPTSDCRVLCFSEDGGRLAWCDGKSVQVLELDGSGGMVSPALSLPLPKTRHLQFSPRGTYLATWEPYAVTKECPQGSPNLQVWASSGGGEKVAEFTQKRFQDWCPQWSEDEGLCARNVTNEVHCFTGGRPGRGVDHKLVVAGLTSFALSRGSPPHNISIYVPGSKGAPSFVRLYAYPHLEPGAIVAAKSFDRADSVKFNWNKQGTAVLVTSLIDVDKTGGSYYGEQRLFYLSSRGEGNMVPLGKKGPIYAVEWNPNSEEFCVVYGFMPSKATLYNTKCDPVFDFGSAHRNLAQFNPQGNILCLAGFGNLRGNMEFWDRERSKVISKPQASDSTLFEWCPDGVHFVTATTSPRLREGNGFKLWHFSGCQLAQHDTPPKNELWEVKWRPFPAGSFPTPLTTATPPSSAVTGQSKPQVKQAAYRPPGLRGKPYTYKLHEDDPPQGTVEVSSSEKLSKSALKNKRKRETKQQKAGQPPERSDSVTGGRGKGGGGGGGGGGERSSEQRDALGLASHLVAPRGGGADGRGPTQQPPGSDEREKKLKNLRKKLRQIEQLKQQQAEGKTLESNQVEKLKMESSLLEEISKLEIRD